MQALKILANPALKCAAVISRHESNVLEVEIRKKCGRGSRTLMRQLYTSPIEALTFARAQVGAAAVEK